ncbi:MAG: MBL fold metallo-hydrolase [Candidatus Thorarchaeota archaeon]
MTYKRNEESAPLQEFYSLPLEENEIAFIYFGFAGILLKSKDRTLALDLGKMCLKYEEIDGLEHLDIQLYSHTHWDHWDPDVSRRILEVTGAKIVAEPEVAQEMINDALDDVLTAAKPGEVLVINDLEISPVTGVHPRPITLFRVKWDGISVFHGADSGPVPLEHVPADIAFLPTGTPSPTCSPQNALKMAIDLKSKIIVTMHGTKTQVEKLKKLMEKEKPDTTVVTPAICELVRIKL